MDLFTALRERRSCRNYLPDPIDSKLIDQILEAAVWAPSPLNGQPWEFVVITAAAVKNRIKAEAVRCRDWAVEKSGWKWLAGYPLDFLAQVPVLIAVVGDPAKTGMDQFQSEGNMGYQHACAAAIQNMHLAAHALGLGSLWFTMFDKNNLRRILEVEDNQTPLALVCLGRPAQTPAAVKRKNVSDKIRYL